MARETKETKAERRALDAVIAKVHATKKPSKKAERRLQRGGFGEAAKLAVRTYDVTDGPKAKGKLPKSLAGRVRATVAKRKEGRIESNLAREAAKPRTRTEIPEPMPFIMAPPLPALKNGKPNIVSLIYAWRAYMLYQSAFNRRNLGNGREDYYQEAKKQFHAAMKDLGLSKHFDWSEF